MKNCTDKKGIDKTTHLLMCFAIAICAATLLAFIPGVSVWLVILISFLVACIAGVLKEVYDMKQTGNHFCKWDLIADIIGAAIACSFFLVARLIFG